MEKLYFVIIAADNSTDFMSVKANSEEEAEQLLLPRLYLEFDIYDEDVEPLETLDDLRDYVYYSLGFDGVISQIYTIDEFVKMLEENVE